MDMVRQLGPPTLFITSAPYEWSFPLHEWVEDEMKKQLRSKLHLPVAETLHIAHVLKELDRGLFSGTNLQNKQNHSDETQQRSVFFLRRTFKSILYTAESTI